MPRRTIAALAALGAAAAPAVTSGARAQAPEAASVTIEVVPVTSERTLLGVDFPTPTHGWAVGDQGIILATTDGGATWREQASGVPPMAPAAGCDRGIEGQAIESTCTNVLFDVDFVDAANGWAVGSDGIVVHTTDGGATWARQELPPLDSISGLGPGPGGTDARAPHWEDLLSVSFPDARSGAVAGPGGTILTTADAGATWQWRGDRRYGALTDLAFADRQHGQATGLATTGLTPFITVATADGGATWEIRQPPPRTSVANANFSGVDFVDAQRGWIAGNAGRILATADAGQSWVVQRRDTTETFQDITMADGRRGLAVGSTDFNGTSRASLAVTSDGGETWTPRLLDGLILWGVDFASPTTAVAVGCTRQVRVERPGLGPLFPCGQSLIARITFPAPTESGEVATAAGSAGVAAPQEELTVDGGSGVSLVLWVGAGAVALVVLAVLAVRRPRRH
ncbi:MAG: WD40/YVTN/BNR-like repeat-containing protein [Acidimicrobiia bacterium]